MVGLLMIRNGYRPIQPVPTLIRMQARRGRDENRVVMHSDQLVIDDDVARMLIVDELPDADPRSVRRVDGSGTVNAIFRIGEEIVARFPLQLADPEKAHVSLQREAAALAELASVSPFRAPAPVAVVRASGGAYPMPWSLQTWVEGDVMTPVSVAGSWQVASDLSVLICSLRAVPVGQRRFRGEGRGADLRDHDTWMKHCLVQIDPFMDSAPLRSMWAQFRGLPDGMPHVMTHSDLTPLNLLALDGRLAGVLDGGWFGPADPSLDLVCAWHLFDAPARAILREGLAAEELEWARGAAWAFEQAMGLVWYYRTSNPAMAWLGESTLVRLLDAHGSDF